jgi:DNA-binding GntR family transcriptional regulator
MKEINIFTKSEYVYAAVKEEILSGEYRPGEKIVIRNVAEKLNVSDIPVREAMRKLEAEKLVSGVPHVGYIVSSTSIKELEEGVALRDVLEPFAGRLAAANVQEEDISILTNLTAQMEKCVQEDDYKKYGRLNREFHETIYRLSGNETLYLLIDELWKKTESLRAVFRSQPARMKDSLEEHKKILQALKDGDGNKAEELIKYQRSLSTKRYLADLKTMQESNGLNK